MNVSPAARPSTRELHHVGQFGAPGQQQVRAERIGHRIGTQRHARLDRRTHLGDRRILRGLKSRQHGIGGFQRIVGGRGLSKLFRARVFRLRVGVAAFGFRDVAESDVRQIPGGLPVARGGERLERARTIAHLFVPARERALGLVALEEVDPAEPVLRFGGGRPASSPRRSAPARRISSAAAASRSVPWQPAVPRRWARPSVLD